MQKTGRFRAPARARDPYPTVTQPSDAERRYD
jgi:hypothetical protein